MSDELTKEDIGLRPIREDEKETTEVKDWRGVLVPGEVGPGRKRTCGETIHSGRASYRCGKDAAWVRDEGRWNKSKPDYLCSAHAGGALRAAKSAARKAAEREERESGEAKARERMAAIAETLGLNDHDLDYSWPHSKYSTTHAVVSIDELEQLAKEVRL